MTAAPPPDNFGRCARSIGLAIDDFGTGFSSLRYFGEFPIDILRIDRSFVHAIIDPAGVPAIRVGLLELGRTLDMEIFAEGIESELQRVVLREHRCTFGQGLPLRSTAVPDRFGAVARQPHRRPARVGRLMGAVVSACGSVRTRCPR